MKRVLCGLLEICIRVKKDKVSVYAAQATLFIIISVMPFLLLLLNFVKADWLLNITDEIYQSDSVSVISVTTVTALWAASKGTMALINGLDNIFGVSRGYVKTRLLSVAYTGIVLILLAISIAGYAFIRLIAIFPVLLAFAVLTITFALMYKFLPKKEKRFFYHLPGAVFSAGGWILFSGLYSQYVKYFADYSKLYGSLSTAVLFILWLYVCMNIFLWGAEINKYIAGINRKGCTN